MASKFVVLAFLVAAAQGSAIHGGDYTSFSYGVSDPHTGDVKSQHETRVGDNVVGQYSLLDSDGTKRTVDYAADAHNGFNAVVRKDPIYAHAAPVVAAPIAHAAPVIAAAPLAHAAPLAYATSSLAYGAHGAAPLAYGAHAVSPLAYGAQAVSPLAYGTHAVAPLAYGAHAAAPLAYGAHAVAPLAYGAHGYATSPLGLGYGAHLGYSKLY